MKSHQQTSRCRGLLQWKKATIHLGILSYIAWSQTVLAASDPLSPYSVPRGKNLAYDVLKTILGEAVDIATDYYFDYSNASFQIEDHRWSEGLGIRYRDSITQTFRSIDFIPPTRRVYQTERLRIEEDG